MKKLLPMFICKYIVTNSGVECYSLEFVLYNYYFTMFIPIITEHSDKPSHASRYTEIHNK